MERINYAVGSVVTGNAIAHAIVGYARALAKNGDSDTVTFPILLDDGDVGWAEILIGPASQVLNVPEASDREDIIDTGLVDGLLEKTEQLARPRAEPIGPGDVMEFPDDL
ncbi:hypothetical protein C8E83_1934 [Frondihabitans australicus]|uniref:Uncharacterized protein n=1 Tax=Frondihabitans australicus TaxID=386892 RepID=A0A495IFU1_9MICO|nr:hypothetical protein C8E83_1934 [Frondihabitans australicus]